MPKDSKSYAQHDLSRFEEPELTWDFYDAYNNAKPTKAALIAQTNSVEGSNLDDYFKKTLSNSKTASLESFLQGSRPGTADAKFLGMPHPFNKLIPLQSEDGRWYDLKEVLKILKLPRDTRLGKATLWEQASAFVIALIRQRVELFAMFQEVHDKAIIHFPTSELIQEAKEIILVQDLTQDLQDVMRSRGVASNAAEHNNSDSDDEYDDDGNKLSELGKKKISTMPKYKETKNAKWKGGTKGDLLAHTNSALSNDPSMQLPVQEKYENMTKALLSSNGGKFLPGPVMTSMKMMGDTLVPEPDKDDSDEDDDDRRERRERGEKETKKEQTKTVDDDYELASDEEWATDSEDEEEGEEYVSNSNSPKGKGLSLSQLEVIIPGGNVAGSGSPPKSATRDRGRSPSSRGASRGGDSRGGGRSPKSPNNNKTPSRSALSRDGESREGSPMRVTFNSSRSSNSNDGKAMAATPTKAKDKDGPFSLPPGSPPMTPLQIETEGNDGSWDLSEEEKQSQGSPEESRLLKQIRALTPKKDEKKIAKMQQKLDDIQIELVEAVSEVERQVDRIKDCLVRGIMEYNARLTYEERNLAFDELTAMLGNDKAAREGFFDWRGKPTKGMRPRVTRFLCLIHEMAITRLQLEEIMTPEGRAADAVVKPLDKPGSVWTYNDGVEQDNEDIGRWGFIWNGVDTVLKVLHSLDFLRTQKEFCSWYGRTFYFTGNCLMLPFSIFEQYETLNMDDQIKEQLLSKAHVRPACSIGGDGFTMVSTAPGSPTQMKAPGGSIEKLAEGTKWKFEKFLIKWREKFNGLTVNRYQNWPDLPSLKEDEDNLEMFTSLMVLYIRCKKSLTTTFRWERKFIGLLSTKRGENMMMGYSGLKPDLLLDREVERHWLDMRENEETEAQKQAEEDAKKVGNNNASSLKFLSSVMQASAGAKYAGKTKAQILAERREVERQKTFQRLTQQKVHKNPDDFDIPYDDYSSVIIKKPGTASIFGRSPTRSPSPIRVRPSSAANVTLTPIVQSDGSRPLTATKSTKVAVGSPAVETTKKKRPKSVKKGKRQQGTNNFKDLVKPREATRAPVIQGPKLTRRIEESAPLPPLRKGGGALQEQLASPVIQRRKSRQV